MGGGGKGKTDTSDDLAKIAKAFFKETTSTRQELTNQMEEALTTGGVGARMPIIRKAEEASRLATSNTLRALDAELAQTGLAGTPFGENIRAGTTQRGALATAGVGPGIVQQFLQMIPGYITGSNQVTVSGLGQAAGAQAQQAGAEAQYLGAMLSPFSFSMT
jgi:hypothetical protein